MYELEIKTKNKLKRIKNPRKARIRDCILYDILEVMDDDGKWHTIARYVVLTLSKQISIVDEINEAIMEKKESVNLDI